MKHLGYALPPARPAKKDRWSPDGNRIKVGDIIYRRTTYRIAGPMDIVKVDGTVLSCVMSAMMYIIMKNWPLKDVTYRIIEIPAGEPWDFDGICVAEFCFDRGV